MKSYTKVKSQKHFSLGFENIISITDRLL